MSKQDDKFWEEIRNQVKREWRHRSGLKLGKWQFDQVSLFGKTLELEHTLPGIIEDTFDNLGFITKDKRKPVRVGRKKTGYGEHLVYFLPPGISFQQVKRRENFFANATQSWVHLTWENEHLHIDIQRNGLPRVVEYYWDPEPHFKKMKLPVPVGMSPKGIEVFDLTKAPHWLIAGESGFGKSTLLHVIIMSLLDHARICVIDPKMLEFSDYGERILLAEDENQILRLLRALNKEHNRRARVLKEQGVKKIQNYQGDDMPYIVCIIDELAEIMDEECHKLINRLLRLSRAVGIHIIAATQRPSVKVISGDSRALFAARLCLLVASETDSRIVLGEENSQAAWLEAIPGRAIWKFGVEIKEVQTMFLDPDSEKFANLLNGQDQRRWDYDFGYGFKRLQP